MTKYCNFNAQTRNCIGNNTTETQPKQINDLIINVQFLIYNLHPITHPTLR